MSCGIRTEPLYTTRLLNLTNMTSIVNELEPSISHDLGEKLLITISINLFNKLDDQLYIKLISSPNDSIEFELSYE